MTPSAPARGWLWSILVTAVALTLISAAVLFSRSETSPSPPSAGATRAGKSTEGVVCFGTVDLEHGVAALAPLQLGRVAEVLVHENQTVSAGAVLLRLEDGVARSRVAEVEASVALAEAQLQKARKVPDQHRGWVKQQEAVQEAMRSRLAAAQQVLAQRQKAVRPPSQPSAAVPPIQPSPTAALDASASGVQVRELEALERAEAQRLADLKAQDVESDIKRAESELAAAKARLEQANLALEECRLKAPRQGTVLRILVGPGDVLGPQQVQPAVLFAADGPQVIRATVEQEFAPRIEEGQSVVVQDEADASVSWRGRVERIAGWYSQRRAVLHDPSQMSDVRTLECVIVLEPGQARLRLGQSVRVIIGTVPP